MSAAFTTAYSAFAQFYNEKKFDEATDALLSLKLPKNYAQRIAEQVEFVVRAAFWSIKLSSKKAEPKYIVHAINNFDDYVQEQSDNLEKQLTVLLMFTCGKKLEWSVALLANTSTDAFNVIAWLRSITTRLMKTMETWKNEGADEQKKQIYLKLTQLLLLFINAEAQHASATNSSPDYGESRFYLQECIKLDCFAAHIDQQYMECFKMLDKFVCGIVTSIKGEPAINWMINAIQSLSTLNKKVRATLAQDNYMMLSKVLHFSYKHLTKTLTEDVANGLLMLFKSIADGVAVTKDTKLLCDYECNEDNIHACYGLYEASMDVACKIVQNNYSMVSAEHLMQMIRTNMTLIGKMTCKRTQNIQSNSIILLKQLIKTYSTKEQALTLIPIVEYLLRKISPIPFAHMEEQMDKVYLLQALWAMYQMAENWSKVTNIGFILMACLLDYKKSFWLSMEYIIYHISKYIKEAGTEINTPHDYLTSRAFAAYKLSKPSGFNSVDVASAFFQYTQLVESNNFYEKYVNQMIKYAVANDPVKSCRFLHYVLGVSCDQQNTEFIETLLKALSTRATKTKDPSVGALYAKIMYLQYAYIVSDSMQKYSDVQLSSEFTHETMATQKSVFRQFNFDMEVEQVNRLRVIKKAYMKFIDFFLAKTVEEQQQFADEKSNILRNGKVVANHLMMRGHLESGLELHWKVYSFAAAVNEEFTMVELCSCMAEHAAEVQVLSMKDNLDAALDVCSGLVREHMKTFDKLGSRKQHHLLNYLLNLVLYMHETKSPNKSHAMQLLSFVIGMVGDIDEDVVSAVYGCDVDIKTVPNKSFAGVRFKVYATIFTMITRYNVPIAHDSHTLMERMLRCLKNNTHIANESTLAVAVTVTKSLSMAVMFCQVHYECTQYEVMVMTMLKYALRLGFVRCIAELILLKLLLELGSEKFESCTKKFNALTILVQSDSAINIKEEIILPKSATDVSRQLCEPIRKQSSRVKSPIRCISPRVKGKDFSTDQSYLLDHPTECACALCAFPQFKYLFFRFGCAHAWFIYLNDEEFSSSAKRHAFATLFDYWQKHRKGPNALPKTDRFYLDSAQMLMWYSHYEWKIEKNYSRSKELLQSALRGLEKVRHYDQNLRTLILHSLESLDSIIEMRGGAKKQTNRKLRVDEQQPDSALKSVQSITNMTRKLNLLDMVIGDDTQTTESGVRFQIHDDETAPSSSAAATPASRKSKRIRDKK